MTISTTVVADDQNNNVNDTTNSRRTAMVDSLHFASSSCRYRISQSYRRHSGVSGLHRVAQVCTGRLDEMSFDYPSPVQSVQSSPSGEFRFFRRTDLYYYTYE